MTVGFQHTGKKETGWLTLTLVALLGLVASGLWWIWHGTLNADEGFYLLASRHVVEGLRPIRDFGFSQLPLLPYVNVPWLELWGYDLLGIRLTGLSWVMLTAVGGARILWRRAGGATAVCFVILLLGAPGWMELAVKGKTYAFAGGALMVSFMMLESKRSWGWRWLVFLVAGIMAVASRLPAAVLVGPAGLVLLWQTPTMRSRGRALVAALVVVAGMVWWSAAGDWNSFCFWVVDIHRRTELGSHVGHDWMLLWGFGPGVWLAMIGAGWRMARGGSSPGRWAWGTLVFAVVAHYWPAKSYAEYLAIFVPSLALAAAPSMAVLVESGKRVMTAGVLGGTVAVGWLMPIPTTTGVLIDAAQATAFLAARTGPDDRVVASMPEIVVAAGRVVPRELTMGKFGLTEELSADEATAIGMVTPDQLAQLIKSPATTALVMSNGVGWNFSWSLPSYRRVSDPGIVIIRSAIEENFELVYTNGHYIVFLRPAATKS